MNRFNAAIPEGERISMLESVRSYYACGRSVTKAAQQLFVHKNTLQYRVKRVLEAMDIQLLSPFLQEYLVRLMLARDENGFKT